MTRSRVNQAGAGHSHQEELLHGQSNTPKGIGIPIKLAWVAVSERSPHPARLAERFQRLCDLVVANYPSLLRRPRDMGTFRAYSPTDVDWSLVDLDGEIELRRGRYPRPRERGGAIQCHSKLEELIGKASNRRRQRREPIQTHPLITRLVQIWPGDTSWSATRKPIRARISLTMQGQANETVQDQAERWRWRHHRIAAALTKGFWRDVHKIQHSTSAQRRPLFTIKNDLISAWDSSRERPGCPHAPCEDFTDYDAARIFWECPAACSVWDEIGRLWSRVSSGSVEHKRELALASIFSLTLHSLGPEFGGHPRFKNSETCETRSRARPTMRWNGSGRSRYCRCSS